jgi:hypothetical protein
VTYSTVVFGSHVQPPAPPYRLRPALVRMAISAIVWWVAERLYAHVVSHRVLFDTNIALYVVAAFVIVISLWRIFENVGIPGWAAIVPFYNLAMVYRVVGRPPRQSWFLLVPVLNVLLYIRLMSELSRAFGGDRIFTLVLVVSPYMGFPMLAFSRKANYRAPATNSSRQRS